MTQSYKISVDTGGTFTDVVISNNEGYQTIAKALTTHNRIFDGMRNALNVAADELEISLDILLSRTELVIYGTTRATNAIVTRDIAKTAFLTTLGFPDILVVKEGGKFNPHDFSEDFPGPYISRRNTFEIQGRIDSEGCEVEPFDLSSAQLVCDKIQNRKFEAIAVCFLWSIANPLHEKLMGNLISERLPHVPFTLSHELIPVVREYRRASAAAIDASLKPLMQSHLRELEKDLYDAGYQGEVLISTIAGGCNSITSLVEKPIYSVNSGPAMAPIAGLQFSKIEDQGKNVIVCDTGGTTFDVGLVREGQLSFTRDTWMGQRYTGHLLGISSVDVRSIGAGGGSIAWIDDGGLMRVGPRSSGAQPGPACYGLGGKEPTVSDAAAVLGYFNPQYFLGGRMSLDINAAKVAITPIAEVINVSLEVAAWRILTLASDLMMQAIGDITINEGFDPRESTIVAGGGAAGINIMSIARELGCRKVVIPKVASALSAAGMQYADIVSEEAASYVTANDSFDFDGVNLTLNSLESNLKIFQSSMAPYDRAPSKIQFLVEARYAGQVWELDTPLLNNQITTDNELKDLVEAFHCIHQRVFAVRDEASPVEFLSWKARLIVDIDRSENSSKLLYSEDVQAVPSLRDCWFGGSAPTATPVYKGFELTPGTSLEGPAIIEEATTTIVVYPGMTITISNRGNYIATID